MKPSPGRMLLPVVAVALLAALAAPAVQAQERWIHVRVVESGDRGETVRVNVPLALAEAVLPSIKVKHLENGRIKINHVRIEDVDMRAILAAVKNTQDGEFVTVESKRENVRVAKQNGYLLVQVRETRDGAERERVDVKVPMTVVEALLSGEKNELDLLAAIRALSKHGDVELVSVKERNTTVRVWIDSKNTSE